MSGRRPGVRAKRAACGVAGHHLNEQAGARKPDTHSQLLERMPLNSYVHGFHA